MDNGRKGFRTFLITAFTVPIGVFAVYVAYLVVPEVLRVVVPSVVQSVATQ